MGFNSGFKGLNELVGGQNEAQWAGVARAGKRGLLNQ